MNKVPITERRDFWKFMTAAAAFHRVTEICDYIIREKIDQSHPLAYPLMLSMVVIYARPFKQRKLVRLTQKVVPKTHNSTHKFLLQLRDKMFAHADTDGPGADEGLQTNKVHMTLSADGISWQFSFLWLRDAQMREVRKLSKTLYDKCNYHAHKIWDRYKLNAQLANGKFEVNIGDDPDEFLVPYRGIES